MTISDQCPHGTTPFNCRTCYKSFSRQENISIFESRPVSLVYSVGADEPIGINVDGKFFLFGEPMKKHLEQQPDFNVIAEHQARLEWEERTKTVAELKKTFLSLPIEFRREVLKDVCMYCLQESREPCHCENDE